MTVDGSGPNPIEGPSMVAGQIGMPEIFYSSTPGFRPDVIAWVEQGGVYGPANIRGGGEYGEAWHDKVVPANLALRRHTSSALPRSVSGPART